MHHSARVLCDWGGTRLRAWLELDGAIAQRREGPGIGMLRGQSPADVLLSTIAPWREEHAIGGILACGMAGSRGALVEVPYASAPVGAAAWARARREVRVGDLAAIVAAGVVAPNPRGAADVMRGEETQLFGAMTLNPQIAAGRRQLLLPGTHSKWVRADAGAITGLQTYVTGELFALLCESSSLLRVSAPAGDAGEGFEAGLERAGECDLAAGLFETRTAQLTAARSGEWARAFLSGLLLGGEVRSMLACGSLAPRDVVTIIGEPALSALYGRALAPHGIRADVLDGEACALAGLRLLAVTVEGAGA